jgi:hypothetical protein
MFPDGSVWGDAVLAEINQDVPGKCQYPSRTITEHVIWHLSKDSHRFSIHRFSHVQVVVIVVAEDLLHSTGSASLEFLDGRFIRTVGLEGIHDLLHVLCR